MSDDLSFSITLLGPQILTFLTGDDLAERPEERPLYLISVILNVLSSKLLKSSLTLKYSMLSTSLIPSGSDGVTSNSPVEDADISLKSMAESSIDCIFSTTSGEPKTVACLWSTEGDKMPDISIPEGMFVKLILTSKVAFLDIG